jgi:catechol 2,3-dioxygenase-like lactoylglutathione lyase family enzyme
MSDVAHVLTILAVSDLARARRFYDALLGWPATVDTPVYVELTHPGGMRVGLYVREGFGRNVGRAPIAVEGHDLHAAELYFRTADPLAVAARAAELGGRSLSELAPRDWGDEVLYLADPDGHVIALARPIAH